MEILSVALIVIAGAALSCGIGRLVLNWTYDAVVVATAVVSFGVSGLALLVFSKLGLNGAALTLEAAIMLTFIFVRFNVNESRDDIGESTSLGVLYWLVLLVIFTCAGLRSWSISDYIRHVYVPELPGANTQFFILTLCLFVVVGSFSMLMLFREIKRGNDGPL